MIKNEHFESNNNDSGTKKTTLGEQMKVKYKVSNLVLFLLLPPIKKLVKKYKVSITKKCFVYKKYWVLLNKIIYEQKIYLQLRNGLLQ